MEPILKVEHLQLSFELSQGKNHVLRDISFELYPQETLAIVGESGSGKSVTIKALLGLIDENGVIESGSCLFRYKSNETVDLLQSSEQYLQRNIRGNKIAVIFQDPMTSLDPTMTIGKQIMESMLDHKKVADKKEAKEKTLNLLKLVGIDRPEERFKHYPHQLSGGMRQRIVIAIALACEPDILIADEPTTALDVTIQAQILELIKDIQKKTGVAIIFITHDLGVVANIADRVAVMYAGKIVEVGTSDEIYYDPRHPYTWGLLSSIPSLDKKDEDIVAIAGTPPDLTHPPKGDAFAYRSGVALAIDLIEHPPFFEVSKTHKVASWLLHPMAPQVAMPDILERRLNKEEVYEVKHG